MRGVLQSVVIFFFENK